MITLGDIWMKAKPNSEVDKNNLKYSHIVNYTRTPTYYLIKLHTSIPVSKQYPKGHNSEHTVIIQALDGHTFTELSPDIPISINCDCERFKYKWEYALNQHGASEILESNGQPANITNPTNSVGLCKHCLASIWFVFLDLQAFKDSIRQK